MFMPADPLPTAAPSQTGLASEIAPRIDAVAPRPSASTSTGLSAPGIAPIAPIVALSGVAMGADGGNLALVSVDRRPEMLLRVGDLLGPSATVVRIDADSMTYRFAGIERRVIVKPSDKAPAQPGPAAQPPRLPGFVPGAPAMARVNGLEPGSGNEAFRQAVEKKMQAIASGR
jgi:hypothetical protein